ncbi:MAG TPA: hypothetical protein VGO07_04455 [Candidatus Saccharimonadales bacterium]|jgi:hypothetical protein|nr:hypothetical protein [Candidatus Saccharimonadales bacterium]
MAVGKKEDKKAVAKMFSCLSFIVAAVLLIVGVVCCKTGNMIVTEVNKGLVEERIYFPPAGSPGFVEAAFPAAQKYAGKQVNDGKTAKAYADDFLNVQLTLIGNGKTSFEVGNLAAADPQNAALQQQQAAMFQIDTSKSLLLLGGYGAWVQGMAVRTVGMISLGGAAVLLVVGASQWMRYKKQ